MLRRRPHRGTGRRRVWLHRTLALIWLTLAVPAWLWWRASVFFVIAASIYANVAAELAAAEAADDRDLAERLDRIEALLEQDRGEG